MGLFDGWKMPDIGQGVEEFGPRRGGPAGCALPPGVSGGPHPRQPKYPLSSP